MNRPRRGARPPEALEVRRLPAGFVVVNTNDSGAGSLRQAILDANADGSPGVDAIRFAIPGTIHLRSPLPGLSRAMDLDASTPGGPGVVLDGTGAGTADGLVVDRGAEGSRIVGLAIDGFSGRGLRLEADRVAVRGCFLGVKADGRTPSGNGQGGLLIDASSDDTIGGTAAGAGNLISANLGHGIELQSRVDFEPPRSYGQLRATTGIVIQGNVIGADRGGTRPLGNSGDGIHLGGGAREFTIGGTGAGAGNLIASNGGDGIHSQMNSFAIGDGLASVGVGAGLIQGNFVGVDRSGSVNLGNQGDGLDDSGVRDISGQDNTIGGTVAGSGNAFAFNQGRGIRFNPFDLVQGNTFGVGTPLADVALKVSGSNARTRIGDPFYLTFTLTNSGPDLATNILLQFDQNGGNPYRVVSGPLTAVANRYQVYRVASLAAGASTSFVLGFQAATPIDYYRNDVSVSLVDLDQTQVDLSGVKVSASIVATQAPSFVVTGSTDLDPPRFNRPTTATFTLTNVGNEPATAVRLGLQSLVPWPIVTAVRVNRGVTPSPSTFRGRSMPVAEVGTLAPGESVTIAIDLAKTPQSPIQLRATATSAEGVLAPGNSLQILVGVQVTNANDSGPGSLRQAILDADADPSPGVDPIRFAIPGAGVHTIHLASPLPTITRPVTIDTFVALGTPVVLDGSGAGRGNGLTLGAGSDGTTIRGLTIDHFSGSGIVLDDTSFITLVNNKVGVDPSGTVAAGNGGDGIRVVSSSHVTIGGTSASLGNVISGNGGSGIVALSSVTATRPPGASADLLEVRTTINLVIAGNEIGTDASGLHPLGNHGSGILVDSGIGRAFRGGAVYGISLSRIGGGEPDFGNVIAGNGGDGITERTLMATSGTPPFSYAAPFGGQHSLAIQGNAIGTDRSGSFDLGNRGGGIRSVSGLTIGGVEPSTGNTILFNRGKTLETPLDSSIAGNRFGPDVAIADLALDGAQTGAAPGPGGPDQYTFHVTNFGPDLATGIQLHLFGDDPTQPLTVERGSAQADPTRPGVLLLPRLAAGAAAAIRVDVPGLKGKVHLDLIHLDPLDPNPENNSAAIARGLSELAVVASTPSTLAQAGRPSTVTFTLTNHGTGPAHQVALTLGIDPLATLRVDSVHVSQGGGPSPGDFGSEAPGSTANLGTIEPGASAIVTITFTPTVPGPIQVTGFATSARGDLNAPAFAGLFVPTSTLAEPANPPALAVTALATPSLVRVGDGVGFAFTVTNPGPGLSPGAYLVLDLVGLSSVEFQVSQGQIHPIPGRPGFALARFGTLAPGASAKVAFEGLALRTGLVVASGAAGADQIPREPVNNLVSVGAVVVPVAQVADVELSTRRDQVDAVQLSFDVPLRRSKAEDLRNYHLSTFAKGVVVPLKLRSARYDPARHEVLIRLAHPLPWVGMPIRLTVGGPGSVGLSGPTPILDPFVVTILKK